MRFAMALCLAVTLGGSTDRLSTPGGRWETREEGERGHWGPFYRTETWRRVSAHEALR